MSFWSVQYDYVLEDLYDRNIGLEKLDPENLRDLFIWKNGMKLSNNKETGFNKILLHIDVINEFKKTGLVFDKFNEQFNKLSSIWKIFLMHICSPEQFPIFDQHVYRAYRFINELPKNRLPENKMEKTEIYFDQYLPFYQKLRKQADKFSAKKIDEALWAYGKFLSRYPKMIN